MLAKLEPDSSAEVNMRAMNLGDSGYMIVRPNADQTLTKLHRSEEMQLRFNAPFQCGMRYVLHTKAQEFDHRVEHNDIVIFGTDGVFDNLYDSQILNECIYPKIKANGELPEPDDAAFCISSLAEVTSYSETIETPWTVNAVAAGREREKELGGKADDITVLVAQVKFHQ